MMDSASQPSLPLLTLPQFKRGVQVEKKKRPAGRVRVKQRFSTIADVKTTRARANTRLVHDREGCSLRRPSHGGQVFLPPLHISRTAAGRLGVRLH